MKHKKHKDYRAIDVYYSYRLYQHFLRDNHLEDDSDEVTVSSLMDYVKHSIPDDYKKEMGDFIEEAY